MSSPFHKSKIVSERIHMKYMTGKMGKGCKTALFGVKTLDKKTQMLLQHLNTLY